MNPYVWALVLFLAIYPVPARAETFWPDLTLRWDGKDSPPRFVPGYAISCSCCQVIQNLRFNISWDSGPYAPTDHIGAFDTETGNLNGTFINPPQQSGSGVVNLTTYNPGDTIGCEGYSGNTGLGRSFTFWDGSPFP